MRRLRMALHAKALRMALLMTLCTEALRTQLHTEALPMEALHTITLRAALYTEALRTIALHVEALHATLYIITSIWRVFFCQVRQGFHVFMHTPTSGSGEGRLVLATVVWF